MRCVSTWDGFYPAGPSPQWDRGPRGVRGGPGGYGFLAPGPAPEWFPSSQAGTEWFPSSQAGPGVVSWLWGWSRNGLAPAAAAEN